MLVTPIQIPSPGEALCIILSDHQVNECPITTNSNFRLLCNLEQHKGLKGLQYIKNASYYMVQITSWKVSFDQIALIYSGFDIR